MPTKTSAKPTIGRYMDLKLDYSFKHIFGREPNKDILIEFLNDLLEGKRIIREIELKPVEETGDRRHNRGVTYDLRCRGEDGEEFIIELQRLRQEHFKDRVLFYLSRLINNLLPKGEESNNYKLPEVYVILIVDFRIDEAVKDKYLRRIALTDVDSGEVFYDKLFLKWLELPNFDKQGPEITSNIDKWMWLFKNLGKADKMPFFMDSRVLKKVFKMAEMENLTEREREAYERQWKDEMDWRGALSYARNEARLEGAEQERNRTSKRMQRAEAKIQKAEVKATRAEARATKMEAEKLAAVQIIKKGGLLNNQQISKQFKIPLEVVETL